MRVSDPTWLDYSLFVKLSVTPATGIQTTTKMVSNMKSTITLASGQEMPIVGFGLWKVPKETTAEAVYNASPLQSSPRPTCEGAVDATVGSRQC